MAGSYGNTRKLDGAPSVAIMELNIQDAGSLYAHTPSV